MPSVYVLYTGGTIGSIGDPLAPMSGQQFAQLDQLLHTQVHMPARTIKLEGQVAERRVGGCQGFA